MAIVRELITRFGFHVDPRGQDKVERSINRLSGMLSGLAAFASLRALARIGDEMQSLEARIGMLPQTVGLVSDSFEEVARHANATRMPLDTYGAVYTRIGHAAKELIKDQDGLLSITDTLAKSLVVGGASAAEQASTLLQFSQALGSGVLQGDEFRAMAEAAPQYLDELALALGYPREELKKMASDGKLTSKAVIEATLKMSSVFDEKFRRMPMTVGAATTIIANKFGTMIARLNRESLIITRIANLFLSGFDRIESGFNSFVDYVGGSSNALKAFGIALMAILGPAALGGFLSLLMAILSPAGLIIAGLVLIGLAIDDVITYLNGGNSVFGDFVNMINGQVSPMLTILLSGLALVSAQFVYLGAKALLAQGIVWATGNSFIVSAAKMIASYGLLSAAGLANGAAMAAGWLIGLWPIGLLIIAFAAAAAAVYGVVQAVKALANNWDKIKSFASGLFLGNVKSPSLSDASQPQANIKPSTVAQASAQGGQTNIDNRQEINIQVPQGTPEAQMQSLKDGAAKAYGGMNMQKVARDAQVYAP